jgi:hypothetical protein
VCEHPCPPATVCISVVRSFKLTCELVAVDVLAAAWLEPFSLASSTERVPALLLLHLWHGEGYVNK